jgi:DNA invertase Pin-like site-specific DNA recombinase
MKLLGYVRVSTQEQAKNGVSIIDQEEKIKIYAQLVDGDLIGIVRDEGKSGKNLNRNGVQEVIKRVISGEADALVVFAIDRLSRSALDFLDTVKRLQKAGRDFISVREQMDSSTPHGRFTMTLLASVAELEREMISARCKDASERCMSEMRAYGKTPYGYKRDDKNIIEDPAEMEVLNGILALRENGYAFSVIADSLNERGKLSKNGGKWHASSVRSVILTHKKLTER